MLANWPVTGTSRPCRSLPWGKNLGQSASLARGREAAKWETGLGLQIKSFTGVKIGYTGGANFITRVQVIPRKRRGSYPAFVRTTSLHMQQLFKKKKIQLYFVLTLYILMTYILLFIDCTVILELLCVKQNRV